MHLLTTTNVDTTRATLAPAEKRLPPVAASSTQLVHPPGSTAGSAEGGYPNLVRAAAPANGRGGDGRERAVYASRTVIRPLAAPKTGQAR